MIEYKLRKYRNHVHGERRPAEKETPYKRVQSLREKHKICEDIFNDSEMLFLTENMKEHVHYLIDKFNDFNKLHRKAKTETIIMAFIFYTYKIHNPKRQISEYSINRKYGLTEQIFELIMCRVIQTLLSEAPIIPKNTKKYDNDILYRTGLRK